MNLIFIFIVIEFILGIVCAMIHQDKGHSLVGGFLWGFFFSIIGLIVVLLEKDKEEQDTSNSNGMPMGRWLLIFLGIGIVLMIIFFAVMIF